MFAFHWNTWASSLYCPLMAKHGSARAVAAAATAATGSDSGELGALGTFGDIGALSQSEHKALLSAMRAETRTWQQGFPQELLRLILQVKREEAEFLGPRLHCTEPDKDRDFLLEEDILGYGFVDKSKLEEIMLTFLNLLCSCGNYVSQQEQAEADANGTTPQPNPFASANIFRYKEGYQPENPEHLSKTWYVRSHQLLLRRLILNDPYVAYIRQLTNLDSDEKWDHWQQQFIASNMPVDQDLGYTTEDLEYLRDPQRFTSFDDFAQKVTLLQNWVLQRTEQNRAWYLTFLFPHGPMFLFAELKNTLTSSSTNYLAYVALTMFAFLERAGHTKPNAVLDLGGGVSGAVKEVQESVGLELKRRFCNAQSPLNQLALSLAGNYGYTDLLAQKEICDPKHHQKRFDEDAFRAYCKSQAQNYGVSEKQIAQSHYMLNVTPYCPVREHRICCQLLEDFGRLLKMDINNQELFHALGQIAVLNMMVYGLEQSRGALRVGKGDKDALKVSKDDRDINIIPVLNLSSRDSGIRRSSVQRCISNNQLNTEMLKPYMCAHLRRLMELFDPEVLQDNKVLTKEQICEIFNAVSALFSFRKTGLDSLKVTTYLQLTDRWNPESQASLLRKGRALFVSQKLKEASTTNFAALSLTYERLTAAIWKAMLWQDRHNANYHWRFGESIGLISSEITRGHCYCMSDDLLRTLVMTVVGCSDHMELSSFLDSLEQRYHIVIGPKQARAYYAEGAPFASDLNMRNWDDEFTKNLQGLKAQLSRLGLLQELSDACEFVHNPFYPN